MKKKAKQKKPKKPKKKTTNIKEIIDFIEDIEKEKEKEKIDNYSKIEEDIEEKEYSEEIFQINKDDIDEISNQNKSNEIIILEGLEFEKEDFKEEKLENKNSESETLTENIENNENEINLHININKLEKENHENKDTKSNNEYDNPPNKYFDISKAKIIKKQEIFNNSNQQLNNKNTIVYSLQWLGKKYFRMTKKKDLENVNNIYYYCINHRTLKNSAQINSKGEKKRVSFCNARIIYVKNKDQFYTDWDHSSYCNLQKATEYENIGDINEQIENYKDLKESLQKLLNKYPLLTLKNFIKKGYKIYDENKCKFNVEDYTFKNIFYQWRKNSLIFTKYSALEFPNTLDNEVYLRDYSHITLYNASGKSQFLHEHMIFISNYFINKISNAEHIYIDGTFLYPSGFNQLIVILYRDDNSGVRYPGLFALINNKKYEGFIYFNFISSKIFIFL